MEKGKVAEHIAMRTENGEGIKLLKYEDDVIMPPMLLVDPVQKMENISALKYREGDVIFCSYPKCGTHWVGNMILKLKEAEIDYSKRLFMGLEFDSTEDISSLASPRLFTTHLWPKRLPRDHVNNRGKTILLLRNPKDAAVSFYHHLKDTVAMSNKQTWDEYFTSVLDGSMLFGSYVNYLEAWNSELKDKTIDINVEVFLYEDFIVDCSGQLKRLANFLGIDRSEEEIIKIVDECSFENLKIISRKVKQHETLLDKDGQTVIYRKGTVGEWKNHFTVAQNEQFNALLEARSVERVYSFKYVI